MLASSNGDNDYFRLLQKVETFVHGDQLFNNVETENENKEE